MWFPKVLSPHWQHYPETYWKCTFPALPQTVHQEALGLWPANRWEALQAIPMHSCWRTSLLHHTALPWNSYRRRSSVLPKWFPSFPTNSTFHCVTLPPIIPSTPLSQPTASPLIPTPAGESRHAAATHWQQEPVFRSNKGLMWTPPPSLTSCVTSASDWTSLVLFLHL